MTRPRALYVLALVAFTFFAFLLVSHRFSSVTPASALGDHFFASSEARFHFLIVGTQPDVNLCRLLLSATVLGYPPPVLIDWHGEGEYDAAQSHLAKIVGPVRYFDSLPASQDNDIVVLLDGYDIVLQLGPDILLQRYFDTVKQANARLVSRFGASHVRQHNMYDSVLFGPDKLCWPTDDTRTRCWAVPESTLPRYAFGPYTDNYGDMDHARPRWLNSGTIMGPVSDMRALFRATQERINKTYDAGYDRRNSDQLYFSDLWGDQEYARSLSLSSATPASVKPDNVEEKDLPTFEPGQTTELHIGLDYESALFQTFAAYVQYTAWIVFNRTQLPAQHATLEPWTLDLQPDIARLPGPYAALRDDPAFRDKTWRDIPLGTNTATGWVFPLVHYTGDKSYRDRMWPHMWFYNEGKRLRRAAVQTYKDVIGTSSINGIKWKKNVPFNGTQERQNGFNIWSDLGEVLPWEEICESHESVLFPAQ